MSVNTKIRADLLASIKRQQEKGYVKRIDPQSDDLPVSIPYAAEVPIRGNVHFGLGLSLSRRKIEKQFSR